MIQRVVVEVTWYEQCSDVPMQEAFAYEPLENDDLESCYETSHDNRVQTGKNLFMAMKESGK